MCSDAVDAAPSAAPPAEEHEAPYHAARTRAGSARVDRELRREARVLLDASFASAERVGAGAESEGEDGYDGGGARVGLAPRARLVGEDEEEDDGDGEVVIEHAFSGPFSGPDELEYDDFSSESERGDGDESDTPRGGSRSPKTAMVASPGAALPGAVVFDATPGARGGGDPLDRDDEMAGGARPPRGHDDPFEPGLPFADPATILCCAACAPSDAADAPGGAAAGCEAGAGGCSVS